jgi:hypothetical protein
MAWQQAIDAGVVREIVRAERLTEHRYVRRKRPRRRLGAYVAALEQMLCDNAQQPKRERLTYQRMFADLRLGGYAGGYALDLVHTTLREERDRGIPTAETARKLERYARVQIVLQSLPRYLEGVRPHRKNRLAAELLRCFVSADFIFVKIQRSERRHSRGVER